LSLGAVREIYYLPGLPEFDARPDSAWHVGRFPTGGRFRSPALTASESSAVAGRVRSAALTARDDRTTRQVIGTLAAAAARLVDPQDELGAEAHALLSEELGWPPAMTTDTLSAMADGWREPALLSLVETEFGAPEALDGFHDDPRRPGRRQRLVGPPLMLQVHAGNVPGVGVTSVLRGLLIRSGLLCKLPEDEPGLAVLFARALRDEDDLLGGSLALSWWPGAKPTPAWGEWVKYTRKVVVYGGYDAICAVRAGVPAGTDVITYGPRIGVAVILPDAPAAAASRLARDVCAYEGRGCVSPRLVLVVAAGAEPFADRLGQALAVEAARLPQPPVSDAEASAIREVRTEAEFEVGSDVASAGFFGADDLSWTVVYREPDLRAAALPRVVYVSAVPDVARLLEHLASLEGSIQTIGYAGSSGLEELSEGAVRLGAGRMAPVGRLAWPPHDWSHNSRWQLRPLVERTDWEMG